MTPRITLPRKTTLEQRSLQRRITLISTLMCFVVAGIEGARYVAEGDVWTLAASIGLVVMGLVFFASSLTQRAGKERLTFLMATGGCLSGIVWLMIVGQAALVFPTAIGALGMLLVFPGSLIEREGMSSKWLFALSIAYAAGVAGRLSVRGLDMVDSWFGLCVLLLIPGAMLSMQWLLTQRVVGRLRDALAESEVLRANLEERNIELTMSRAEAERASTLKSQFLANMSHELRTPLTAILSYSEMVLEDLDRDGEADGLIYQDVARIGQSGERLLAIVSDLLDAAKIEAGSMELHLDEVDVADVVTELEELASPWMEHYGNTFRVDVADGIGALVTDRTRLVQVVAQLLSNAAKFTDRGTVVLEVSEHPERDAMNWTVRDTGIGMDDAVMGRIFEAFEQGDGSTTRRFGGLGLGLTLARQGAQLLHAELGVESALGEGSTFCVEVPRVHPDAREDEVDQAPLSTPRAPERGANGA